MITGSESANHSLASLAIRPASPVTVEDKRFLEKVSYIDVSFQHVLSALRRATLPGLPHTESHVNSAHDEAPLEPESTLAVLYLGITGRSLPLEPLPKALKLPFNAPISTILEYLLNPPEGSEISRAGRLLGKKDQSGLLIGRGDRALNMGEVGWALESRGFRCVGPLDEVLGTAGNASGYIVTPSTASAERTNLLLDDDYPDNTRVYTLYIYYKVSLSIQDEIDVTC